MMNFASASEAVRGTLAESQVLYLPLLLQLSHGADGLFDWSFAVETVAIVEVNLIDPEALQRFRAGLFAVLRRGIDLATSIWEPSVCEFGRQEDVLALIWVELEPFAHKVFRVPINIS